MKLFKNKWSKLELIWLFSAVVIITGLGIYWGDSTMGIISAAAGVASVIMIAKGEVANFLFGAINVTLYAMLAFKAGLYGDVMLNSLYYLPMQFVGAYMWYKAGNAGDNFKSNSLTKKQGFAIAGIAVVAIGLYGMFLSFIGGNIPFIDSTSTVLSIFAMFLMVNSFKQQWILWIIVNTVSIIMWIISLSNGVGDVATALMWTVYLANSIFGYISWSKAAKEQ